MNNVITTENIPIKMWLDDIEDGALQQAKNLAQLPFAFKHIAIMPDSHLGFGMPIGGVLAAKNVVIPNAVGVDIGCGMIAMKTNLMTEDIRPHLKDITKDIYAEIPVGFCKRDKPLERAKCLDLPFDESAFPFISQYRIANAKLQLGTLGGGNHFIEIQQDTCGVVWIMIHSGSRHLGKCVADYYNKIAIELNQKWHSCVPKEYELAFLPADSPEGSCYLNEMNYCMDYAERNRNCMMDIVSNIISNYISNYRKQTKIEIAHNFARLENHFGENVYIHRKGATPAFKGQFGIIPGSQGTNSYIVRGLGNKQSFCSCSHGAGRLMGRKQAKVRLNLDNEMKRMNDMGIIHNMTSKNNLDEAPGAYKDIDAVMSNQDDLTEILEKLSPIAVVKG